MRKNEGVLSAMIPFPIWPNLSDREIVGAFAPKGLCAPTVRVVHHFSLQ